MQIIELYIGSTRVDMFKDESVTITDTIKNVKDIAKVFTAFSQQFSLPASKTNNKLFKHYYNYDIDNGFDARARVAATIKLNGTDYKIGRIKLNGVQLKQNKPYAYKVVFYDNTVALKDVIGEDKLNNLSFVEVKASGTTDNSGATGNLLKDADATFTTTASEGDRVKNTNDSTYATILSVDSDTQLTLNLPKFTNNTQGYEIYLSPIWENDTVREKLQLNPATAKNSLIAPLITHNKNEPLYYNTGEDIENSKNLDYNSGADAKYTHGVKYTDLKLALRVHSIIEAIENTYSEIDFTTDFFSTSNAPYYNLYMWLNRVSGEVKTSTSALSFMFQVSTWTGGDINQGGAGLGNTYGISSEFNDFGTSFNMEIADSATAYTIEFFNGSSSVYVTSRTAGQGAYTLGTTELGDINTMAGNWSVVISADATVIISDIIITLEGVVFDDAGSPVSYTNTINSNNITTLAIATFDVADQMPEMKVTDFLTGLFKMFNLIAFKNDSGKIEVRTLDNASSDSYYNLTSIKTYDISEYVDVDKSMVNVALPFKEVKFFYEDLKSFFAVNHEQLFNQGWGTEQWNEDAEDFNIDGKVYNIKLPFSHFKYERLVDLDTGVNTSIQWGWSVNESQNSLKGKPLMFYPIRNSGNNISYMENNTKTAIANYNVPSNSRFLDNASGEDNIHFGTMINEYDRPLVSFSGTLFNNYYYNYITNIFRLKARIVKLTAYLPLRILLNYNLNDYIVVNGRKFRINSIKSNLLNNKTDLELITHTEAAITDLDFVTTEDGSFFITTEDGNDITTETK
jgi:hypothetical protein